MKDAGTRNATFVLKNIIEQAVQLQKDVYVCVIDYTKAFDKDKHEDLFEELGKLDLFKKDLSLLQRL